jgi:hypothetical protein
MARNAVATVKKDKSVMMPAGEAPPMTGGTLGVASSKLTALPAGMLGAGRSKAPAAVQARQWRVTNNPSGMVSYPGMGKTRLPVGKVISEASCDVEHIRRQGVELVEVTPPAPPSVVEDVKAPEEVEPEDDDQDSAS